MSPEHGRSSGRRRPRGVHVRIEGVTFGYGIGRPVLRSVSLDVGPGRSVALVGATRAGKTTLASLVPRSFDPWHGRITFDGTDLREIQFASLQAHVALVPQEPFLLPLSVRENIAYGVTGATPEEVAAAARTARAEGFILWRSPRASRPLSANEEPRSRPGRSSACPSLRPP